MDEEELRIVELRTWKRSGLDIISETWPLWYSIYVRKYGYRESDNETRAEPSNILNEDSILQDTQIRKHTAKKGRQFKIPCGDWRHAVNFRVTEAEKRLEKKAELLRQAAEEVAGIERTEKVKIATPKTVLMPAKYHAARWKSSHFVKERLTGVKKLVLKNK